MKTKLKETKAITLIALIITIIVMLILVGVTVSVVINSNLLGTAKDAVSRTKAEYEKEAEYGDKITVDGKRYANIDDYLNNVEMVCDHEYGEKVTVEVTCETAGMESRICKICGYEDITTTPALGHEFDESGVCKRCNKYKIECVLTHLSKKSGANAIATNSTETIVIAAVIGYDLPNDVSVSGATKDSWNKTTGTLVISNPTGKVTITAEGPVGVSPYIGCFVDADGKDGIDGVIFVDRAYYTKGQWGNDEYTFEVLENLKDYTVSSDDVVDPNGHFRDAKQIILNKDGGGTEDRFIVMKLADVPGEFKWTVARDMKDGPYRLPTKEEWCAFANAPLKNKSGETPVTASPGGFGLNSKYWSSTPQKTEYWCTWLTENKRYVESSEPNLVCTFMHDILRKLE